MNLNRLTLLVLALLSNTAYAQTPSPFRPARLPPGEDVFTPLKKGETAPHDGVLFDKDTALRWGGYLEQYRAAMDREVRFRDELLSVELNRIRETQQLVMEVKNQELLRALQRATELEKEARKPLPFYKSVWFGVATGVTVTAAAGLALVLLSR